MAERTGTHLGGKKQKRRRAVAGSRRQALAESWSGSLLHGKHLDSAGAGNLLATGERGRILGQNRGERAVSRMTNPFGPMPAASASGERISVGATDAYAITEFGPDGTATRVVRREVAPQAFTEAHFRQVADRFPQMASALAEIPRPSRATAFASLLVDRENNLWVQDYPSPGAASVSWAVFNPKGDMLGQVALPAAFRPTDIGADYVLGVWTDDWMSSASRCTRFERHELRQLVNTWPLSRREGGHADAWSQTWRRGCTCHEVRAPYAEVALSAGILPISGRSPVSAEVILYLASHDMLRGEGRRVCHGIRYFRPAKIAGS